MTTTILLLPPELLSQIFSHLNPFDLECVAKTFDHHLYGVAIHLLKPRAAWVQNARRMCAVFCPSGSAHLLPSYPGHINPFKTDWSHCREEIPATHYQRLGLDPANGPYIRTSPPDLRRWMKLDDSFGWLVPLDSRMAREMEPHTGREGHRSVADDWQVDLLAKTAQELGLTLSQGFETFLRNNRLHHRIPSYHAWFFQLSRLVKCPSRIDSGAGGYLLRFHVDQQYCAFDYLYMNPAGNHCVILPRVDVYEALGIENDAIGRDDAEMTPTHTMGPSLRRKTSI